MFAINYLILTISIFNIGVYCLLNVTVDDVTQTFANLTEGNDLWSRILTNCKKPTLSCIKNNMYTYIKGVLERPNDVQFTSFLKFSKNSVDYKKVQTVLQDSLDRENNHTSDEDETPMEEMSRSLSDNTMKFFTTHDLEINLPQAFFFGSTLKISPRSLKQNGALVKVEFIPNVTQRAIGEGRVFIKQITKFLTGRLLYALLAILLVIKLLAVNILFVLPTIVGAATAKKLLLKVLLFVFPALHHLFKFCAYVPHGAKHHIHKHQISHIHQIEQGHHHKPHHGGPVEVIAPHDEGPPSHHHQDYSDSFDEPDSLYPGEPYYGNEIISHRRDPHHEENEVWGPWDKNPVTRRTKPNSGRPPSPVEIENMLLKAEKEALIKLRLQKEKQRIHEENLRLQEQLNNALKIQERLKQEAAHIATKIPLKVVAPISHHNIIPPSKFLQTPLPTGPILHQPTGINLPEGYINPPRIKDKPPEIPHTYVVYQPKQQPQAAQARLDTKPPESKKSSPEDDLYKAASKKPSPEDDLYKAASITFDPFYSPILEKIDAVLRELQFNEEPCRERLICSMYKNPVKFSPHSNLLSVELSRDTKELQKPASTNAAVVRFYRYVQAARDGQDKRDCIRLYPACTINTEL